MGLLGGAGENVSYVEYQIVMFCLAGILCFFLGVVEMVLRRFHVLQMFFPGAITIQQRRFFFFHFDVSDSPIGKKIRALLRMLVRLTTCVVISYLWQHCVLDTFQTVGTDFPSTQCQNDFQCFASDLHIITLTNHKHTAIDCDGLWDDFGAPVMISCVKFVRPAATTWLMHLSIAYSLTQLNFKAFEVLVWITGNSDNIRKLLALLVHAVFAVFICVFFAGEGWTIFSSWLSFVTTMACPLFLYLVVRSGRLLCQLWREEAERMHGSIEAHLNTALQGVEAVLEKEHSGLSPAQQDSCENQSSPEALMVSRQTSISRRLQARASQMTTGIMRSSLVVSLQERASAPQLPHVMSFQDDASDDDEETHVALPARCARLRCGDLELTAGNTQSSAV